MYTRELPDHMVMFCLDQCVGALISIVCLSVLTLIASFSQGLAIVENHKHLKQHWLPVCSKKKLGCADGPVTLCVARAKDLIISLLFHSETSESTAEAMGEHLKKTYEVLFAKRRKAIKFRFHYCFTLSIILYPLFNVG